MSLMHAPMSLADLVDLRRYPLADDSAFTAIAASCRSQLRESSFACLPGFLKAGAAQAMTAEVLDAIPRAYRREQSFSAYDQKTSQEFAPDHVRRRVHQSRQFVVAMDVLPKSGLLRTLYGNETLTQRIAQLLDEPALFTLADPVMGCTATAIVTSATVC